MSADIETQDVIKAPTIETAAKDRMLTNLKAAFKKREPTEQSPIPKSDYRIDSETAKSMAITALGDTLRIIHSYLESYQPVGMFEPFDIATRKGEIEYINIPQFIEGIFNELLLPGNEGLVVIEVIRRHLARLLKKFPDRFLPLTLIEPELSHFASCLVLIAAKEHKLKNLLSNQRPTQLLTESDGPIITTSSAEINLAELERADDSLPAAAISTNTEHTTRATVATVLAPEQELTALSATPIVATEPTSATPLTHAKPRIKVSSATLILSGSLALASSSLVVITHKSKTHSPSVNRTSAPLKPAHTNIILPPPSAIPEVSHTNQTLPPQTVTVSSIFFFGAQSSLEYGVRTALLSNTDALAHCITRPNTDPRHLAYGLTGPITNYIRRSGWTVGLPQHPRGISITWTDNGQCNDFKVTEWEQSNDATAPTIVYPETPITIITPISTIVNNRALYHRLPVIRQ